MKVIADRFLFKVPGKFLLLIKTILKSILIYFCLNPGLGSLLEAFEVTPGSKNQCVKLLEEEHMLSISPGGVREALFSDHNYEVIWGTRAGFAKIAIEAKCVSYLIKCFLFSIFLINFLFYLSQLFQCILKIPEKLYEQFRFLKIFFE